MARLFSIKPTWTLKGRKFFGLRGFSGKPTHPPLTDFPIVCYSLAGLFDLVSWWEGRSGLTTSSSALSAGIPTRVAAAHDFFIAGTLVLVIGFVVSLGTALTGFMDWWKGFPRDKSGPIGKAKHTQAWRTANFHMAVMLTVTVLVVLDLLVRFTALHDIQVRASAFVTILSILAAGLVLFGAGYGGTLVFEYQFNVESIGKTSTVWDETEEDQFPGRKPKPTEPSA
jgi:uncharacterized membrane protein